jgi:DNA-binding NtrC family response regulator
MLTQPKILLVDDEEELREIFAACVHRLGFRTAQAEDGRRALELLNSADPSSPIDAVISDIQMPRMDGLALLEEARAAGIETPFVLITGFADKEKAVRALRLGAYDFLEKPCDWKRFSRVAAEAGNLGVRMRELASELELLRSTADVEPERVNKLREARRELLRLKRHNQTISKKSA